MRMVKALELALNGEINEVHPPTRRGLYAIATEGDETVDELLKEVRGVRRLLVGLTTSFIATMLALVVNILLGF